MQLSAEQFAQDELFDRLNVINERLNTLKIESEEVSLFTLFFDSLTQRIENEEQGDMSSRFVNTDI